jgi:hypothetical protein
MNMDEVTYRIRKVQGRIQSASEAVREIMQRQQRRLDHNRRFLEQIRS